jgi:hypothetical protein
MRMKQNNSISDHIQQTTVLVSQQQQTKRTVNQSLTTRSQQADQRVTTASMQRQIDRLTRTVAQKEHDVWTLKQLLLYR